MPAKRMHRDEIETDAPLARRLIESQFPQWAHLPVEPVESGGTDNALYRLGGDKVIRMPRVPGAVAQVEKEQRWLPILASLLPLAIPQPVAVGQPEAGYPYIWSVYRWLEGDSGTVAPLTDPDQAAVELAGFIAAMRAIQLEGGPRPSDRNSNRGEPLINRDAFTRNGIATLPDIFDKAALTRLWERALAAPLPDAPVWIHGDLHPANLLIDKGRIHAVIDFGCLGMGDPATDVMAAWNILPAHSRALFRAALNVDDALWDRARGWSLSMWVGGFDYYLRTNPIFIQMARFALGQILGQQDWE
ncbi:MAG: aminoglycoside phosphotransferase family protein [Anaerolineae bacterium]